MVRFDKQRLNFGGISGVLKTMGNNLLDLFKKAMNEHVYSLF